MANGLTVDGDVLSWRLRIRLRTIRGERADFYAVHMATLQSTLEHMAPKERVTWNNRLSGQLIGILRYGVHINLHFISFELFPHSSQRTVLYCSFNT